MSDGEQEWTAQELLDGLRQFVEDDRDGFSRRVHNPVTERSEKLDNLAEDGYCRRFLELVYLLDRPDVVDLGASPVLTFDKDRWEIQEQDEHHVLVKSEAESKFDELVLGTPESQDTDTDQ